MKKEPIIYEGICYALLRCKTVAHSIARERFDLVWYPENGMSLLDQIQYRPYVKSVVSESPWIISCYDREEVRLWDGGKWKMPDRQTYGADIMNILDIIGIDQTMASTPLDGGRRMKKLVSKIEKEYKMS